MLWRFPWHLVDGEAGIARVVAFLEERQHDQVMARQARLPETRWGDAIGCPGPRTAAGAMVFRGPGGTLR